MIRIHSIETLGALDGPGLRTVLFFQGCPSRCRYCHNADTFDPVGGTARSEKELAKFCARYKNFYGRGGGVTLSGGEPLMQESGAVKLMELLKKEGIHTALDTSGVIFAPRALKAADLVILDIKHTDKDKFFELTGLKADNTFKTLEFLKEEGLRFWVRQVTVPGFTDSPEQVRALKKMAQGAEKIELLPYHSAGAFKWEKSGLKYTLNGINPPESKVMEELNAVLNA